MIIEVLIAELIGVLIGAAWEGRRRSRVLIKLQFNFMRLYFAC